MSPGSLHDAVESGAGQVRSTVSGAGRIGICHLASGDRWAGAEVQIATLLKFLARDERLALCAILLNRGRLAQAIEQQGIPVMVIPEDRTSFRGIIREAARFLANRRIQIIHSHRYKENLVGAWLARRCNIPCCVRTQHGLPESQRGYRALKQGIILSLDRFVARHATERVISVSMEMTRQLARNLPSQKIETITNGVDVEGFHSRFTTEKAKENLGIAPERPVIGTAGRLEPIKRLDIFLKAAVEIAKNRPNAAFVIAGEGCEEASLARQALALGIDKRVSFLRHRDDVEDVLRAFDVLVLSSDHEGLPMVLLEALALGVVVVARAVGGIPEVIQDGTNGILVDSADPRTLAEACLGVLTDRARTERLIRAGIESVEKNFGAARTTERVAQLYLALCERR